MQVNKSVQIDTLEELIKVIQKLEKENRTFNFNGNVDNTSAQANSNYSVNCTIETEEF